MTKVMQPTRQDSKAAIWALRLGLAFVFLYAAVSSLQHPLEWAGFFPAFMREHVSATLVVRTFSIYELFLVLWLLSGRYLKYVSILCTLTLLTIVVTTPSQLITTFRDVGLMFMSLGLFFLT